MGNMLNTHHEIRIDSYVNLIDFVQTNTTSPSFELRINNLFNNISVQHPNPQNDKT